jgi:TolA-binding protein
MTKFRKLITPLVITVIVCATLALGYHQAPLRLSNPFSGAEATQEKKDQSVEAQLEAQELRQRIAKLESEVAQMEKRIDQLQKQLTKPRVIPLSQK